jgi:hypothetical protein
MELWRLVDLLFYVCVWFFASLTLLRADTVSQYLSICKHIHLNTVQEHDAGYEFYSSHNETKILAMNVTFKLAERVIIVVANYS